MAIVSENVATTLAHYVDHVFGVMGKGNAWLPDALQRDAGAQYTAMRHEAALVS